MNRGKFLKLYIVSLGAGLLVGIVYHLLNVRSPAPPAVALIGLLGMLLGEQVIPVGKQWLSGSKSSGACTGAYATEQVCEQLSSHSVVKQAVSSEEKTS